jgi:RNA polymerase sigma-70 factor (ECF subfamily)
MMAVAEDESSRVRRALEELPVIFREAVVMRELEGMSYKEIAGVTGVSIGTVMSRLARGRDRLRAILVEPSTRAHAAQQGEPIP